jgi:hypothetical protein
MLTMFYTPSIFLSILFLISCLGLFAVRFIKTELSRDFDDLFIFIQVTYSAILISHGWRLDPILIFAQFLLIISINLLVWENLRLRGLVGNKKNQET